MQEIKAALKQTAKDLYKTDIEPELTRPDEKFGDFATNVAMQLGKELGHNPREVAVALAGKMHGTAGIEKVEIAGPGFINFTLRDEVLAKEISKVDDNYGRSTVYKDKVVVAEYSDPNPFKVLHAGHLYTSIVGDALANLYEMAGAKVHRVNFGGDVGLHVAKTMWSILRKFGGEHPEKLSGISDDKRAEWLAEEYIAGSLAYGDDEKIDNEIKELNKNIYQIVERKDKTSPLAQIYWTTRQWSYEYFKDFYKQIGSGFEKYYPESEVAELGLKTVKEQLTSGVFKESNGAVIFPGEDHNLHTRVFINKEGLPTYEAKDVGLILTKWQDYHFDLSIVITGNEQAQYMQVVLKALEQFEPELTKKTIHLTHGLVKLQGGIKMSSRMGNILKATDVLEAVARANKALSGKEQPEVSLGAVKYSFLKQGIGADIVYNPEESVSIAGNSGPYLQYAHARAMSILEKARDKTAKNEAKDLQPDERSLARKISEYPEAVARATQELMPHHIATYLYELAQNFNRFYENNRVIGDDREEGRLKLVKAYAQVLKNGLALLSISAPDKI